MYAFIGIDSWKIYDWKFFTLIPEFISILLLLITAIVNKTVPNTDMDKYDEFKDEISSNLYSQHKRAMTIIFIINRFI